MSRPRNISAYRNTTDLQQVVPLRWSLCSAPHGSELLRAFCWGRRDVEGGTIDGATVHIYIWKRVKQ